MTGSVFIRKWKFVPLVCILYYYIAPTQVLLKRSRSRHNVLSFQPERPATQHVNPSTNWILIAPTETWQRFPCDWAPGIAVRLHKRKRSYYRKARDAVCIRGVARPTPERKPRKPKQLCAHIKRHNPKRNTITKAKWSSGQLCVHVERISGKKLQSVI